MSKSLSSGRRSRCVESIELPGHARRTQSGLGSACAARAAALPPASETGVVRRLGEHSSRWLEVYLCVAKGRMQGRDGRRNRAEPRDDTSFQREWETIEERLPVPEVSSACPGSDNLCMVVMTQDFPVLAEMESLATTVGWEILGKLYVENRYESRLRSLPRSSDELTIKQREW